jgi:hypothetical protein
MLSLIRNRVAKKTSAEATPTKAFTNGLRTCCNLGEINSNVTAATTEASKPIMHNDKNAIEGSGSSDASKFASGTPTKTNPIKTLTERSKGRT